MKTCFFHPAAHPLGTSLVWTLLMLTQNYVLYFVLCMPSFLITASSLCARVCALLWWHFRSHNPTPQRGSIPFPETVQLKSEALDTLTVSRRLPRCWTETLSAQNAAACWPGQWQEGQPQPFPAAPTTSSTWYSVDLSVQHVPTKTTRIAKITSYITCFPVKAQRTTFMES